MHRATGRNVGIGFLVVAAVVVLSLVPAEAQIKWGPYFKKHQSVMVDMPSAVDASIERGKKFFNELGCGGCHPRGGTIGGTAINAAGVRVPFEISDLHGAANHFPRFATKKAILVDLGQMNDL